MYLIMFTPGTDYLTDGEIVGTLSDYQRLREEYQNMCFVLIDEKSARLESIARDKNLKVN